MKNYLKALALSVQGTMVVGSLVIAFLGSSLAGNAVRSRRPLTTG